jgi:hypothetical protein
MWAAGGAGGQFANFSIGEYPGGGGGAGGATILYTADAAGLQSVSFTISPGPTVAGTDGGSTTASFSYSTRVDTFTALGGLAGGTACCPAGTSYTPASGGRGQGVIFIFNNQSTTPPPNFIAVNGTNGGNAGPEVFNSQSKGFDGQSHPLSGEPGGIGGIINGFGASGPGGGGAGYQGVGGSGANFATLENVVVIGVAGPPAGPGGGGAGQGPVDVDSVVNGGAGGALIIFS